jgi:sec-independent protein translocase protein TatB
MHFADYTLIFLLALILFGPKKLPEIARQIGKLMMELRRASNEFKSQIDDELRNMEQQDRQKKWEAEAAKETAALPAPESGSLTTPNAVPEGAEPVILPPSTGETVSAAKPFMPVATPELLEAAAAEPHPVYAEALAAEQNGNHQAGSLPENTQAVTHHG